MHYFNLGVAIFSVVSSILLIISSIKLFLARRRTSAAIDHLVETGGKLSEALDSLDDAIARTESSFAEEVATSQP